MRNCLAAVSIVALFGPGQIECVPVNNINMDYKTAIEPEYNSIKIPSNSEPIIFEGNQENIELPQEQNVTNGKNIINIKEEKNDKLKNGEKSSEINIEMENQTVVNQDMLLANQSQSDGSNENVSDSNGDFDGDARINNDQDNSDLSRNQIEKQEQPSAKKENVKLLADDAIKPELVKSEDDNENEVNNEAAETEFSRKDIEIDVNTDPNRIETNVNEPVESQNSENDNDISNNVKNNESNTNTSSAGKIYHESFELPEGYNKFHIPITSDKPIDVNVHMRVMRIYEPDWQTQTVEFDADVISQWFDHQLVTDLPYNGDFMYGLDPGETWYPEIVFFNQRRKDWFPNEDKIITMVTDGRGNVRRTANEGSILAQNFDYQDYPFDAQLIEAKLVSYLYDDRTIKLNINKEPQEIVDNQKNMDMLYKSLTTTTEMYYSEGKNRTMVVARFQYTRETLSDTWILILPCMIITVFSTFALYISPTEMDKRVTISSFGILSIMTFLSVVNSNLPPVNYMTFMLEFTVFSFVVCFFGIFLIIIIYILDPSSLACKICSRDANPLDVLYKHFENEYVPSFTASFVKRKSTLLDLRRLHFATVSLNELDEVSLVRNLNIMRNLDKWSGIFFSSVYIIASIAWLLYEHIHRDYYVLD